MPQFSNNDDRFYTQLAAKMGPTFADFVYGINPHAPRQGLRVFVLLLSSSSIVRDVVPSPYLPIDGFTLFV